MEHRFFVELTDRVKLREVSQGATEALIDALAFVMSIDGSVDRREEEALIAALGSLPWEREGTTAEAYAQEGLETYGTRGAALEGDVSDFCRNLQARVESEWLQDEIYVFVGRMIRADDQVLDSELRVLSTLGAHFDIFAERKARLDSRIFRD